MTDAFSFAPPRKTVNKTRVEYAFGQVGRYVVLSENRQNRYDVPLSLASKFDTVQELTTVLQLALSAVSINDSFTRTLSRQSTIVRIETREGTEVRRLLSDRDGAREDEWIKYAVFGNMLQGYLPRLGDERKIVSLDEARLFDTAQEAIPVVREYCDGEGRRIAVSTTPPVITETVLV